MLTSQAPTHFNTGRDWQQAPGYGQPNKPDERLSRAKLDGPIAPAALMKLRLPGIDAGIACREGLQSREELHDRRVGVHGCERFPVRVFPLSQPEARCFQFN